MPEPTTEDPGAHGIADLLRTNAAFRRLWYGQIVSQAGDWFNQVAVMFLLYELTGSGEVVAGSLILRMLPGVVVAPIAGLLVDRLNRKRILILSDVVRGLLVPLFLIAAQGGQVWLVYVLLTCQVCVSSFFEPARSAVLPSVVSDRQLLSANALTSVTWSSMLAIGSMVGGVVIAQFGLTAAFLVDAASFFLSALFIAGVRVPRRVVALREHPVLTQGFRDLAAGLRYIRQQRSILSLVIVKTGIGLGGGMVLLLTVFSDEVFPIAGGETALTMGVLFFARGIGTAIGPFIGRAISGYDEASMRRLIPFGFLQAAVFFVAFGLSQSLLVAILVLCLAHVGTSINWVFSTVLLQMKVADEYRGRVFSAEMALFTLAFCLSTFLTGLALDEMHLSPRTLAIACGCVLLLPAAAWGAVHLSRARAGR